MKVGSDLSALFVVAQGGALTFEASICLRPGRVWDLSKVWRLQLAVVKYI